MFDAVEGFGGGGELVGEGGSIGAGLFLEFESQRELRAVGRGFREGEGGGPVDGAVIGRKVLILFAVIVMDVSADGEFAERLEGFGDAFLRWAFGEEGVANVKIEAQAGEAGFVDEGAQVGGLAHFAGGVFNANGYADMFGVKDEVLKGAESGVAFARVGGFAGAAHVEDQARERQVFSDVDDALEFVHGLDAADALDFGDGEGAAAFAIDVEVAAGGGVEGSELEVIVGQGLRYGAHFGFGGVVEMAAGGEDFDSLKAGAVELGEEFPGELLRDEQIGGEDSLHKVVPFILRGEVAGGKRSGEEGA